MGRDSAIQWTDHTFNPWVGCTKISPGCDNCYAEGWAKRSGLVKWGSDRRRTSASNWREPLRWNALASLKAERETVRPRVFCASLADVFDSDVPPAWRSDLFTLIRQTPYLDWLLLTKRIGNVARMLPTGWGVTYGCYDNVWIGITLVNQEEADRDIPKLLKVPATVRFLSCEPLLGPIGLDDWLANIDWVIVGGESGGHARPMDEWWCEHIRQECAAYNVPFFMKQGSQANWRSFKDFSSFPSELQVRQWPTAA